MLDTLNNLTPVIAIGGLAVFMTLERWLPYFEQGVGRGRHRWHNLGLVAIGFLMNAVLGSFLVMPIAYHPGHAAAARVLVIACSATMDEPAGAGLRADERKSRPPLRAPRIITPKRDTE